MSVVERIIGTQILLRGQVTNSLTSAGITATLQLEFDQGAGFSPLPFPLRQQPGGFFAVAARLNEISARMQIGKAVTLRLTVSANGYQVGSVNQSLTAAQFARKTSVIMVSGVPVPADSIAAAPVILKIALEPLPVMLAGQVLSESDFAAPVAGANVRITGAGGSQVITNTDGRFRFDAPPLALSVPLRVTLGARVADAVHIFDFTTPINFKTLNLPTT